MKLRVPRPRPRMFLAQAACAFLMTSFVAPEAGAVPLLFGRVFVASDLISPGVVRPTSLSDAAAIAAGRVADEAFIVAGVGDAGDGGGRARYQAEFGRLRAEGQLSVVAPAGGRSVIFDSGATGLARFEDTVIMNAPGMTGLQGSLRVRVDIDGTVRGSASGLIREFGFSFDSGVDSGWLVDLQLGDMEGGYQQRFGGCQQGLATPQVLGCISYGEAFGVWTSAPITFTFGAPTSLAMQLAAGVSSRTVPGGESAGAADLFNTVEWLDMVDVRDAFGRPVTGFATTSITGTNWAARMPMPFDPGPPSAVPAPAAIPLLGLLAALLLRRRKVEFLSQGLVLVAS